ncbi:AI-2E family transporter [Candidatus Gottesmanbacteria bacterium]|nr:AI-2E family transporter [Candidatus Gottesmanbacteria bacterium]
MPAKIEISHKTIFFTFGFLAALWFLWQIKEIILVLFLAFILMSALRPFVEKLERFRIPRVISILFVYLVFLSFLGLVGGAIFPPLIFQTLKFWERLPELFNRILPFLPLNFEFLTQQLTPVGGNILRVTLGFFSNVVTLVTFLVFTFYLLLERKHLEETFKTLLGEETGERIIKITWKIEERLGAWVRGQVTLMFLIGLACFIGLTALGVDYALPLALTAGILEIIPIAGPILGGIPAVLVALVTSPVLALAVAALYFIIQQLENNLIVPTVMRKATGLPPIITLLSLMIGGKLAGIFGAFLAVPTVVVLQTILQEVTTSKK